MALAGLINAFLFHILCSLGVNSIYAAIASFSSFLVAIVLLRKDLLVDSLMSGLCFGAITLVLYLIFLNIFPEVIQRWWYLHKISGILLLGIPFEELAWAFGMGAVAGPLYEFMMGVGIEKQKTKFNWFRR